MAVWAPLMLQILTIKRTSSVLGRGVKRERVLGAERAAGAVMRRVGVGPQDAVQHAEAEPSV